MRSSAEYSIDLSTEDLLQDSSTPVIENVNAKDHPPSTSSPAPTQASVPSDDDSIEIELTAEQIDALLSGQL